MFCTNCGKKLLDECAYCPVCGSSIDCSQSVALSTDCSEISDSRNLTNDKSGKKSGKVKIFSIIGVVFILTIVIICSSIAYFRSRTYVMVEQTFLSGGSYIYTYNEDGLCIKKILADSMGSQYCETNKYSNDVLAEKIIFEAYDSLYRCEYVCDSLGNIVSELSYDGDGGCLGQTQYEYDEIGNKISETGFRSDGTAYERTEYEYDKCGNPVKWTYYDNRDGLTDNPLVITFENKYDLFGNLVSCTAWQSNGLINQQVDRYSYSAKYLSLSSYMSQKDYLDAELRETYYIENRMVYTDGYIEFYFSGLEATRNYLGTDDNFFEIDFDVINNRDTMIAVSPESLKINGKNVTAGVSTLFLEPGDSGILRIFNRGFTLDGVMDDITDVVFKVKVSDSVSKGANGSTSWHYGANTVLNLTESVYFDFPVFTGDSNEESGNLNQSNGTSREIIKFGKYEQDNDYGNGAEEIEWVVLDTVDDRIMVVSRYALDNMSYNYEFVDTSWSTSTLRNWLNGEFLSSAFTEAELARIQSVEIDDYEGFVFLLNEEKLLEYFGDDARTTQTTYTRSKLIENIYTNDGENLTINSKTCDTPELATAWVENMEAEYGNNCCKYWLRSSDLDTAANFVYESGGV